MSVFFVCTCSILLVEDGSYDVLLWSWLAQGVSDLMFANLNQSLRKPYFGSVVLDLVFLVGSEERAR